MLKAASRSVKMKTIKNTRKNKIFFYGLEYTVYNITSAVHKMRVLKGIEAPFKLCA